MDSFIDHTVLASFPVQSFESTAPFPWWSFEGFLTPAGFEALYEQFPSLSLFERHRGAKRAHGQRPHDRYYLAYESSIYHEGAQGVARRTDLPAAWQAFMAELEGDDHYRSVISAALGLSDYEARYAWHVGTTGSEVSPHLDAPEKSGTHILYFNRAGDWEPSWGGRTVVLAGRATTAMNPDFDQFATSTAVDILDNRSFLFKNTPDAWHGVQALTCPSDARRRLFNVIFEVPGGAEQRNARATARRPLRRQLKQLLSK
jgi:hypothetical protein